MDIILDRSATPDMHVIEDYIEEPVKQRWLELICHIEGAYRAKPQISYSICAGKPGWNVKYKKSGKALCTLYPEPDSFIALVVLSADNIARFLADRAAYTDEVNTLFDKTKLFNGTKWLMIRVSSEEVLADVKRMFELKLKP